MIQYAAKGIYQKRKNLPLRIEDYFNVAYAELFNIYQKYQDNKGCSLKTFMNKWIIFYLQNYSREFQGTKHKILNNAVFYFDDLFSYDKVFLTESPHSFDNSSFLDNYKNFLTPKEKYILHLKYIQKLNNSEINSILKISSFNINKIVFNSINKIKKENFSY